MTDTHTLAEAREEARKVRAQYLILLSRGAITVGDILSVAATQSDVARALRRLPLIDLVEGHLKVNRQTAKKRLEDMVLILGSTPKKPVTRLTVGWVLDARTHNRRLMVFADAVNPKRGTPPFPTFPHEYTRRTDG